MKTQRTFDKTISLLLFIEDLGLSMGEDLQWTPDSRNTSPTLSDEGLWEGEEQDYGGTLEVFHGKITQEELDAYHFDSQVITDRMEIERKLEQIDEETQKQFNQSFFEFEDHIFSITQNAQINWGQLEQLASKGWYGEKQSISTKDGKVFLLMAEQLDAFLQTFSQKKMEIFQKNHNEKQKLRKENG